jgi:hypothetical protein
MLSATPMAAQGSRKIPARGEPRQIREMMYKYASIG